MLYLYCNYHNIFEHVLWEKPPKVTTSHDILNYMKFEKNLKSSMIINCQYFYIGIRKI